MERQCVAVSTCWDARGSTLAARLAGGLQGSVEQPCLHAQRFHASQIPPQNTGAVSATMLHNAELGLKDNLQLSCLFGGVFLGVTCYNVCGTSSMRAGWMQRRRCNGDTQQIRAQANCLAVPKVLLPSATALALAASGKVPILSSTLSLCMLTM